MEYNNEAYGAIVETDMGLPPEEIDAFLKAYPKSKLMLAALIRLIQLGVQGIADVDDWECDLGSAVWEEVCEASNSDTKG